MTLRFRILPQCGSSDSIDMVRAQLSEDRRIRQETLSSRSSWSPIIMPSLPGMTRAGGPWTPRPWEECGSWQQFFSGCVQTEQNMAWEKSITTALKRTKNVHVLLLHYVVILFFFLIFFSTADYSKFLACVVTSYKIFEDKRNINWIMAPLYLCFL